MGENNFSEKVKRSVLNRSDTFKYYEKENESLKKSLNKSKKEYKKLKKYNKKLYRENKSLNNKITKLNEAIDLTENDVLFSWFLDGAEDYDETLPNLCPICGNASYFVPHGLTSRKRARCQFCGSLERMRLAYLIIKEHIGDKLNQSCSMLHFAPERVFYNLFKNNPNIEYHPVDINPKSFESRGIPVEKKVDMQEIPYEDKTFDFIFNSHVLEHVPDDIKAMGENYRVLKDDGICLISVPLYDIPETFENEEYNTPELRLKYFDQEDHLRKYGDDLKDRLESVGFKVKVISTEDVVNKPYEIELYRIPRRKVFICTK